MAIPSIKGITQKSQIITISGMVTEELASAFNSEEITLPLSTLDKEIFVVLGVNLDIDEPDLRTNMTCTVDGSLSVVDLRSAGSPGGINDPKVICSARTFQDNDGTILMSYDREAPTATPDGLPYIALVATDNFHVNVKGTGNNNVKTLRFRMYGYRAQVRDAGIYAAMVQSELLSNS